MRASQHQVVLALLGIMAGGAVLIFISRVFTPTTLLTIVGMTLGTVLLVVLFFVYWRGWEPARYVALIAITLLVGLTTDGIYLYDQFTMAAFLPPILALIIAELPWVAGSAITLLLLLIVRTGGQSIYVDPVTLILYAMPVGALLLARVITDTAQHDAEQRAEQIQQALMRAEAQSQTLAQQTRELEAQNAQQHQLLDLVTTLETPAVAIADGVLLAPLVGHLDKRRANALTMRLLHEVNAQRTRMVILDIAGVPTVDAAVVESLLQAINAIRLLGCEVTITGISAAVATTMTQLDRTITGVRTARTPQEVLGSELPRLLQPQRTAEMSALL